MSKVSQSYYNIYQQEAIQALKHLTEKYSDEKLIDSLFSTGQKGEVENEIYLILNELKKNVSIEDLSSFLFHIINGETYETILFSPSLIENNKEEEYNKNIMINNNDKEAVNNEEKDNIFNTLNWAKDNNNIFRIKLNYESSDKDENEAIPNKDNNNDINEKHHIISLNILGKKSIDYQNRKMINKPIIKLGRNKNLDILDYNYNNDNNNIPHLLEFITVNHKPLIEKYNKLLHKLINSHNLNINEFINFTTINKRINNLLKKKSCKKLRLDINGLSIVGKHYHKDKKGKVFFYKPISCKRGKKVKFICSEGEKCGALGYYNLLTKKFEIVKEHKLEFEKHKICKVKDRVFINKLNRNDKVSDIQEYILLAKCE